MSMKWKHKGREFESIGYQLKDKKTMIIYGAGDYAEDILNVYEGSECKDSWKLWLVDRDEKKQQEGKRGYRVMSPEELWKKEKENYFVVICATPSGATEIKKGLLEHEIKEEDIYDYSYFLYTYLPIYFMYVKNKLFFTSESIIPSTVCDLNCRSCLNFNPYIKKHIVDSLEEVKADIDAFFGQVDLIYRLQISGGEPFLYKELGHVLEYIYENYKDKVIRLETVTNGTIVPSDELCRILKKCKVTVFLDDYRKTLPNGEALYERVKNKLNQEEISVIYNYAEKWIRMYSENSSHEEDSEEKLESFYERCGNPWSTLRKKKITGCNYAHYAAKAGILPDDEDNYFVLTGEVDKKALLEFRLRYNEKGYVEFCKKCAGWASINPNLEDAAIQKAKE